MSGKKEIEYQEAASSFRYFHDSRMKLLNFFLTFNGVLLIVGLGYLKSKFAHFSISIFALIVSVLMLGVELRTIFFVLPA